MNNGVRIANIGLSFPIFYPTQCSIQNRRHMRTHARGEVLNKDDREVSAAMARHAFLLGIDELSESLLAVPLRCSISSNTVLAS